MRTPCGLAAQYFVAEKDTVSVSMIQYCFTDFHHCIAGSLWSVTFNSSWTTTVLYLQEHMHAAHLMFDI